jgi:glycosyltransferase involved in cell wall biosynthesis
MSIESLKLSVCITAYNHEKYIAQAIESALDLQVDFDYGVYL